MFLLVWDKDSYTGSFLVLFPCIYVLQLQLRNVLFWCEVLFFKMKDTFDHYFLLYKYWS
jgi:hypothetical protein